MINFFRSKPFEYSFKKAGGYAYYWAQHLVGFKYPIEEDHDEFDVTIDKVVDECINRANTLKTLRDEGLEDCSVGSCMIFLVIVFF
jgi:hypothetical protein